MTVTEGDRGVVTHSVDYGDNSSIQNVVSFLQRLIRVAYPDQMRRKQLNLVNDRQDELAQNSFDRGFAQAVEERISPSQIARDIGVQPEMPTPIRPQAITSNSISGWRNRPVNTDTFDTTNSDF